MREQRHIMRPPRPPPPPPPAIGCESVCQNGFCKSENKAQGRLLQVLH